MSNEKTFFDEQIASLRALSSIHQYLADSAASMDASSLLRSEYVLIVSTFDSYLHNIVMIKNFDYPEKPLKYKHIRRISD